MESPPKSLSAEHPTPGLRPLNSELSACTSWSSAFEPRALREVSFFLLDDSRNFAHTHGMNWSSIIVATMPRRKMKSSAPPEPGQNTERSFVALLVWILLLTIVAALAALAFGGCVQHSPNAKVSTVVNVSIMPPASTVLPL